MTYPMIRPLRPLRRAAPHTYWQPGRDTPGMSAEMMRMLDFLTSARGDGGLSSDIVDFTEHDEGWTVTARLPGFAPDEVSVEVDGQDLYIEARQRSEEAESAEEGRRETERGQESEAEFSYRLTMPAEVDTEQVDATMEHGLLTVALPRSGQGRRRRVQVGAGRGAGNRQVEGEVSG